MNDSPTHRFGRYEIRSELGSGAMGVVYRGYDPEIGRQVAIKTIKRTLDLPPSKRKEYLERFRREAQAAGRLSGHANIVPVFDVGLEGDLPYIVMAYVEGQSLDRMRRKQTLTEEQVAGIVGNICAALEHAHRNGIIHRDVKPANILMTPAGAVLTDFGIARLDGSELTRAGTFLGSPSYMSPEQVRGTAIDGRSDLFSLAVIAYLLLTGEKPFPAEDTNGILYKIVNDPHPDPATHDRELARWTGFFAKALAKQPEDRFADAASFEEAFRRTAAGETVVAGPPMAAAAAEAPVERASDSMKPTYQRTLPVERHNPLADRSVFFNMDVKSQVSKRRSSSTTDSGRIERLLRSAAGNSRRGSDDGLPPMFWAGLVVVAALLGGLVLFFWPS